MNPFGCDSDVFTKTEGDLEGDSPSTLSGDTSIRCVEKRTIVLDSYSTSHLELYNLIKFEAHHALQTTCRWTGGSWHWYSDRWCGEYLRWGEL